MRSGCVALLLLFAVAAAHAESSSALMRIIVPFAPGGINDTAARLLQPYLEKAFGQSVIIENRPGASGITAAEAVARMPPDGYNIIWGTSASHSVSVVAMTAPRVWPS